jgi:hypothetical protein
MRDQTSSWRPFRASFLRPCSLVNGGQTSPLRGEAVFPGAMEPHRPNQRVSLRMGRGRPVGPCSRLHATAGLCSRLGSCEIRTAAFLRRVLLCCRCPPACSTPVMFPAIGPAAGWLCTCSQSSARRRFRASALLMPVASGSRTQPRDCFWHMSWRRLGLVKGAVGRLRGGNARLGSAGLPPQEKAL